MKKKQRGQENKKNDEHGADIGVLFVHGIGQQKPGDTLRTSSKPLFNWFRKWLITDTEDKTDEKKENVEVTLSDTRLTGVSSSLPAHTKIELLFHRKNKDDLRKSCLLAESHWADSFPMASFIDFAIWVGRVLPWTLITHFGFRLFQIVNDDARRLKNYPLLIIDIVGYMVGFCGAALLQVVILLLTFAAVVPIPWIKSRLMKIQLMLAESIGDSYVFLEEPLHKNAIVEQVRSDLKWLAKHTENIAIVAHSQGAAVSYDTLIYLQEKEPALAKHVKLLVTYGSGLNKLHDIRCVCRQRPRLLCLSALIMWGTVVSISLGLFWLASAFYGYGSSRVGLPFSVTDILLCVAIPVAVSVAASVLAGWCSSRREKLVTKLKMPWLIWKDCYASADLVPAGELIDKDSDRVYSKMVSNQHNLITDHSGYWKNITEFVSDVVFALADQIKLDMDFSPEKYRRNKSECSQSENTVLTKARSRRRWTVRRLAWARSTILVTFLYNVYIHAQQFGRRLAEIICGPGYRVSSILYGKSHLFRLHIAVEDIFIGIFLLLIPYGIFYLIVYFCWSKWDRRDTTRFFERRQYDCGRIPYFGLLIAGFILPIITIPVTSYLHQLNFMQLRALPTPEFNVLLTVTAMSMLIIMAVVALLQFLLSNFLVTSSLHDTMEAKKISDPRWKFIILFLLLGLAVPLLGLVLSDFALLGALVVIVLILVALMTGWIATEGRRMLSRIIIIIAVLAGEFALMQILLNLSG